VVANAARFVITHVDDTVMLTLLLDTVDVHYTALSSVVRPGILTVDVIRTDALGVATEVRQIRSILFRVGRLLAVMVHPDKLVCKVRTRSISIDHRPESRLDIAHCLCRLSEAGVTPAIPSAIERDEVTYLVFDNLQTGMTIVPQGTTTLLRSFRAGRGR